MTNERGSKWEMGLNYTGNQSKFLQDINGDHSNYEYMESIAGLYTQFSGNKNKVSYSFDLRLENSQVEGGFVESTNFTG